MLNPYLVCIVKREYLERNSEEVGKMAIEIRQKPLNKLSKLDAFRFLKGELFFLTLKGGQDGDK